MSQENELSFLLARYLANSCSAEELNKLFSLIDKDANREELLLLLKDHWNAELPGSGDSEARWERMQQKLQQEQEVLPPSTESANKPMYQRIAIAASVCFLLAAGIWFFTNKGEDRERFAQHVKPARAKQLLPGGNKATLTLANGKKVILDDKANGTILKQAGIQITKKADGKLVYKLEGGNSSQDQKNLFNTIETPRGGQYEITMPDGTSVWLNAMSSLKYPLVFDKKERKVFLTGEGYFEVAKASRPFVVKTADQEVEVLGTHFNINAYDDENVTRTTLLEGAVNVREEKTGSIKSLTPGRQVLLKSGRMQVQEVDTELVVAWKNGTFNFNRETLESIMRQVSRWYDVEVEYRDEAVKKELLSGSVSRFKNAGELIQVLSLTKVVHFKIEGRRIVVMK